MTVSETSRVSEETDNNVQTNLLVRDGLNNTAGQKEEGTHENRDDVGPDRQLSRPSANSGKAQSEVDQEKRTVPPKWDFPVGTHKATVDVI